MMNLFRNLFSKFTWMEIWHLLKYGGVSYDDFLCSDFKLFIKDEEVELELVCASYDGTKSSVSFMTKEEFSKEEV